MCFSASTYGIIGSLGQGAFQAAGALTQSRQESRMYQYQSDLSRRQAQITQIEAGRVNQQNATARARQGLADAQFAGSQMNQLVASGVSVGAGTSANAAIGDTAYFATLDRMEQYNDNLWQLANYTNRYNQEMSDATNYSYASRSSRNSGLLSAAGAALGGIAGAYQSWAGSRTPQSSTPRYNASVINSRGTRRGSTYGR